MNGMINSPEVSSNIKFSVGQRIRSNKSANKDVLRLVIFMDK